MINPKLIDVVLTGYGCTGMEDLEESDEWGEEFSCLSVHTLFDLYIAFYDDSYDIQLMFIFKTHPEMGFTQIVATLWLTRMGPLHRLMSYVTQLKIDPDAYVYNESLEPYEEEGSEDE